MSDTVPGSGAFGRWISPERLGAVVWWLLILANGAMIFSIALAHAMVLACAALWVVKLVRTRPFRYPRPLLFWLFLGFIAARVLSILLSEYPALSAEAWQKEMPLYAVFFIALGEIDLSRPERLWTALRILFWAAVGAALVGLGKYFLIHPDRITSTTSGFYTLGMYLSSVFILSFALGPRKEFVAPRALWLAGCAIMMLGVLFTFNRIHWVTMGLAVLVVGIARERLLLGIFAAAGVLALFLFPDLAHRFDQLLHLGANTTGRDVIWRGAWMIIGVHPWFGFGPRSFREIFPLLSEAPDQKIGSWHNDFLQVYMDSGAFALALFACIVALSLFYALRNRQTLSATDPLRAISNSASLALAGFALAGGMMDTLLSMPYRFLLAVVVLVFISEKHQSPKTKFLTTSTKQVSTFDIGKSKHQNPKSKFQTNSK